MLRRPQRRGGCPPAHSPAATPNHMVNGLDPISAIQIPGSQSAIETRGDFSLSRYRSPAMPHANIKLTIDEFIPEMLQIRPMLVFRT